MKKILKVVAVAIIGFGLLNISASASATKGQKLLIKKYKKACGFNGSVMAKKHSQDEWKSIYESGKLNDELLKQCPKAKPAKEKYLQHIFDFLHNYANDSGNVPSC